MRQSHTWRSPTCCARRWAARSTARSWRCAAPRSSCSPDRTRRPSPPRTAGATREGERRVPATQVLDSLPLVDDHSQGVAREIADRAAFESYINEGFDAPPEGMSHFDTPIGLAVRRWCPPVLGLEPHASADTYLTRRADLGSAE